MTFRLTPTLTVSALSVVQWSLVALTALTIVHTGLAPPRVTIPPLGMADLPPAAREEVPKESASSDLSGIWNRSLRQALIEPKVPDPPPPKATPAPPVNLPKLSATFVEHGRAWALFVDDKGAARVRTTTEKIGDFTIVEITPGAATIRRDDKTYEVKTPAKVPAPRGGSRSGRSGA